MTHSITHHSHISNFRLHASYKKVINKTILCVCVFVCACVEGEDDHFYTNLSSKLD